MPVSKVRTITVSNLKAISGLTADFNGCSALITGRNNCGKSSFLRSLPDRLRGIKPDIIVKSGESEGFAEWELTTGERFIWSFDNKTAKGERLIFITKDQAGNELKGSITQEIMKRYFPAIFDVDEFLQASPQKQKKILEQISGIDLTAINDRYKVAYDDRTYANKKYEDAKASLKPINPNLDTKEVDVFDIQQEIAGMELHNHKYQSGVQKVETLKKQLTAQETEIKRLKALLNTAETEQKAIVKNIEQGEKWIADKANQPKGDDVSYMLHKKLQDALDKNEAIKKNNEAIKSHESLTALEISAKEHDKKVKAIELEKMKMIKESNLPEGFEFSGEGILYNNLPFTKEQLSSSGIYIAALKLAAMNLGEVRTLHFDASTLDRKNLEEIERWANSLDLQLLIEKPDFEGSEIQYQLLSNIE